MIVFGNIAHARTIAKTSGTHFNPECDVCISRENSAGELLGGVIYQNYTRESISMHVAALHKSAPSRELLWVVFHYPFVQLGVKRIFGQVPERNTKALEFDLWLGFKIVTKVDGVFPDGGVNVIVLEKDDCRWLNYKPKSLRPGQEI